ncbi:adaptor protein MecA [Tenuibacillus multivorans]|uniref:Adapter protein MecA n=1 Tax=Tenuibacillus multivorans TaxID=237069 RepID=A0A1H0CWS4_9BACI|nr:adaptor protein MecA [Tenuibacillus multivorans]GEL76134.1 adapter protein MecA 2 [Tenuibacillus multivorans]SDN62347.1 adapter protein MecA 1/2 [Tenuibacillus multivorans]
MRLERISVNQFKIFLTYDDLNERGYTKEDLWNNLPKANQLFQDMLYEACEELNMDLDGMLKVKVHMLQAQGMIIVVTQNDNDQLESEEYIELKVTMDESKEMIFVFNDFEDVIQSAKAIINQFDLNASLYAYDDLYYLNINETSLTERIRGDLISIMSEYASPSTMTSYILNEHGNVIAENNALQILVHYF